MEYKMESMWRGNGVQAHPVGRFSFAGAVIDHEAEAHSNERSWIIPGQGKEHVLACASKQTKITKSQLNGSRKQSKTVESHRRPTQSRAWR